MFAVGKAAEAVGKAALAEDGQTKDVLLRIAEGTPEMTAAARSMAARAAVRERVKLKLYQPFARMLGVSMAYFEDTFPHEMGAKIADIPDENLITPPASLAVPALQGLSYTFEEPDLKELYLNLLATASDSRQARLAHPAFADIVKQLSPAEAKVLPFVLVVPTSVVRVVGELDTSGISHVLISHLFGRHDLMATGKLEEDQQEPMWVDNWRRLGLVSVRWGELQKGDLTYRYDWVQTHPEYVRLASLPSFTKVYFDKGQMESTEFGYVFSRAVISR